MRCDSCGRDCSRGYSTFSAGSSLNGVAFSRDVVICASCISGDQSRIRAAALRAERGAR